MAPSKRRTRRTRLLDLLTEQFPNLTRDELYRRVMCSEVLVDGGITTDPRAEVRRDAHLEISVSRYVSRGGEKLEAALLRWAIEPAGRVWLDAGASTGGFTDCLLQAGAERVHAVDVGYNQLDYRLRSDRRVVVHERTNVSALSATPSTLEYASAGPGEPRALSPIPDAAVCDLSFRSLRGALRHVLLQTTQGWGIALLKPQFEVAAEHRWGRSPAAEGVVAGEVRARVIERVRHELAARDGVRVHAAMDSPTLGRSGNREVLLLVGLHCPTSRGQRRRSPGSIGSPTNTPSPPR